MDQADNSQIRRSISMPVKPRPIEPKSLKRSEEKEKINDSGDYYPESPIVERRRKNELGSHLSRSANNVPCTSDWVGSTIELNLDSRYSDPLCARRRHHRVIEKSGHENVNFRRIPQKSWRYFRDLVTTMIELDWKYMLTIFIGTYFATWFFFALLNYMVAYSHGDLMFDEVTGERLGEGKEPCIKGVYNFVSMIIYSVETQTTIGFGEKYASDECPEAIFLFVMQMIFAIGIEGMLVSMVYAKTARPAKQITKLKFSDKAVICFRDGKLCLLFRVCDPRKQQTIESKIRVYLITDKCTREGEFVQTRTELKLDGDGEQIITWPEIVCHVIDEASPLNYLRSAKDLNEAQFELYVSIVGTSAATAMVTEARTSYVPCEDIFWGQRFVNIISYDGRNEHYVVDYRNFNTTISVDMKSSDECGLEKLE
ncbi:ATP-sensitive inward rectifier potassium channel 15 [Anastrepha obliqua]|uniref:ATP-sensitive inward rectifier potassium channel 15 n=1 Tax=Anastrepha obliqua TaxID=95512 RepID=UPI00240A577F|nr:ATP-sensitive inward rectifier potassium channel 15 [Anastrepha obliqua]XP_054742736.1 ATP-sensitive inward rectifier potassium channel 15 [Anastrepha obliqua]